MNFPRYREDGHKNGKRRQDRDLRGAPMGNLKYVDTPESRQNDDIGYWLNLKCRKTKQTISKVHSNNILTLLQLKYTTNNID